MINDNIFILVWSNPLILQESQRQSVFWGAIYTTFTFMHLADAFIQSDLLQAIHFFYQYVCSLGIEPTTFCAANTMLYHWATGRKHVSSRWPNITSGERWCPSQVLECQFVHLHECYQVHLVWNLRLDVESNSFALISRVGYLLN